jgi:PhzF family phenazine biosynthesis protein
MGTVARSRVRSTINEGDGSGILPGMDVLRYAAFTTDPAGGNPAGVVLDAVGESAAEMQRVAAEVGYSETAFLVGGRGADLGVRYFSPLAEVPFCGHATIATAVAHAQVHGPGDLHLATRAGQVDVTTDQNNDGVITATLTSVTPRTEALRSSELDRLLTALGWPADDLDPALPPRLAHAGAWHPIIAVGSRRRLANLDYDFPALGELMAERDWTTVDLVFREAADVFHARNPFPPGGVVEDPATGAAAAAFGGYLRDLDLVTAPAVVTVHQGQDMGRPSLLTVAIPAAPGSGIDVTGAAVRL